MKKQQQTQRGYTLLEYCAGAAIIAGIVFGTLTTLEGSFTGLANKIASWVDAVEINTGSNNGGSNN